MVYRFTLLGGNALLYSRLRHFCILVTKYIGAASIRVKVLRSKAFG